MTMIRKVLFAGTLALSLNVSAAQAAGDAAHAPEQHWSFSQEQIHGDCLSALREMDDAEDDATLQVRLNLMQGLQASGDDATDKVVQMYTRQMEAKINGEEFDMRKEMQSLGTDFWRNTFGRGESGDRGSRDNNRGENRRNQPTIVPAP